MSHRMKSLFHLAGVPCFTLSVFWAAASQSNCSLSFSEAQKIHMEDCSLNFWKSLWIHHPYLHLNSWSVISTGEECRAYKQPQIFVEFVWISFRTSLYLNHILRWNDLCMSYLLGKVHTFIFPVMTSWDLDYSP